MRLFTAAAIALLAFSLPLFGSSRTQREHGAQVYADSGCQHCHTLHAVGGHKGPDLSSVGRTKSKTEIRNQIVYGSKVMPEFGDILEQAELNDLVAYLRSCRDKPRK
jgi:mono/diheme cytochrome c family protein